jgi:hypothetical protein
MKKIIIRIFTLLLGVILLQSCNSDKVVEQVDAAVTSGAILRTIQRVSVNYNIFDMNSTWSVQIEEQDAKDGGLLQSVVVYASYTDNEDDGIDNNKPEQVIKTLSAADFTTGSRGLPVTTITISLSEALASFGLGAGQFNGGDMFNYRLEVVLTDGRAFSTNNTSGTVSGGSFFSSPFAYTAGILCVPPAPITGDYTIDMQDLYGDGWQGSRIEVNADGVVTSYFIPSYWDAPSGSVGDPQWSDVRGVVISVPAGTSSLTFTFVAGDWPSEVVFQIYGPAGSLVFDGGPSEPVGELELNLCKE